MLVPANRQVIRLRRYLLLLHKATTKATTADFLICKINDKCFWWCVFVIIDVWNAVECLSLGTAGKVDGLG